VVICNQEQIEKRHLPAHIVAPDAAPSTDNLTIPVGTPLSEVERKVILNTLARTDYNKTRTADILGISLKTLHNKLKAYKDSGDDGME